MKSFYKTITRAVLAMLALFSFSCKKFVEIDPPRTDLIKTTVFASDATANAAMADIYFQMKNSGFSNGSSLSYSVFGSISSDESIQGASSSVLEYQEFNDNSLSATNTLISILWNDIYNVIFKTNAIMEGLSASTKISVNMKQQLEGEAKFIRSFCYFYLVNLWGNVPLVLTTDFKTNNSIHSSSKTDVYKQIIKDLKDAQILLPETYSFSNNERVRANKGTATALLSRVYLYNGQWTNAEAEATSVISNISLYSLNPNLLEVYRATSKEPIFQLWNSNFPNDRITFFVFSFGPNVCSLRPQFVNGFEVADQRWAVYGRSRNVGGFTYYYPIKYSSGVSPVLDYSTVLRLSEQYLIRAEARAKQGKITGPNSAESDINIIRTRAGLGNTTANTESNMLLAIEQERKIELCTEWGHRWLDLKRTGRATAILGPLKPNWQVYKELYPIPEAQLINNPNTTQNPGY